MPCSGGLLREDGGIEDTRNLSSHLDNNCTGDSVGYNYFGTVESVERLQLPGEVLDGKFWSISALSRVAATYSPPGATCQAAVFLEQLAQRLQEQGLAKGPCHPSIGDLCSDLWLLLLITEVQTKRQADIVAHPCIITSPTPSSWGDIQRI